jgi:hypothetical protein
VGRVEAVCKAVQDVLAPDIKAMQANILNIKERINCLDNRVNARLNRQDERLDRILTALDVYKDVQALKAHMDELQKRTPAA